LLDVTEEKAVKAKSGCRIEPCKIRCRRIGVVERVRSGSKGCAGCVGVEVMKEEGDVEDGKGAISAR